MQMPGRLAAAIEVLDDIMNRHRPASVALRDWGRAHRFAGSGDRAAIGNIVFDALRNRASIAYACGSNEPRALALGTLAYLWGEDVDGLCDGSKFAPLPLSDEERARLASYDLEGAPDWVKGNYPQWLHTSFKEAFGDKNVEEAQALAQRAPVDVRVNTLKENRHKVLGVLEKFHATPTPFSPLGLRITPPDKDRRNPHVESDIAHGKGWFEVQDEGSQLASMIAGVKPGMQVCDLCAGSGGKALAFSASMQNKGQIYAYDIDPRRLRPIFERITRAGALNVEVLDPAPESLVPLEAAMDIVFVDAPCSGTGAWRRKPDAKWRFKNQTLEMRLEEQREVLQKGATLVKPGGRLIYVTCSILPRENEQQIEWFLKQNQEFSVVPVSQSLKIFEDMPENIPGISGRKFMALSPATSGTDGFFGCVLQSKS